MAGDPHNLRRYSDGQKTCFDEALGEIQAGSKRGHWIWYMIPTPPFVVDGVEKGSPQNVEYALRTDDQARAVLSFEADGVNLRQNYVAIMKAILEQLRAGKTALGLLGEMDEPKLVSSAELFERITRDGVDDELNAICKDILKLANVGADALKSTSILSSSQESSLPDIAAKDSANPCDSLFVNHGRGSTNQTTKKECCCVC